MLALINDLTTRQREMLDMIVEHIARDKRPPSIVEIAAHFGIKSPNGVAKHLAALESKGVIQRGPGARSIKLAPGLDPSTESADVSYAPILGRIAAGMPTLAAEFGDETIPLPKALLGGVESAFVLEVNGESMIEDGILHGDYVVVASGVPVRNGDIAAVRIEDEATVKRVYREGKRIRLQPANSAFEPIILEDDGRTVEIAGKVVGLLRSYGVRKLG